MKNEKRNIVSSNSVKFPGKIQNKYLARSILLRETGSSATIKNVVLFVGLILAVFILWSTYLELDEVASTTGKIVHQGDAVMVESLSGGRVKKVFVQNGAFVKEGQVLIQLDPAVSKLELESILVREQFLLATKNRLEALLSGSEPDFSKISDPVVRNTQIQLYTNTKKSVELERETIIHQIEQVETEISLQKISRKKFEKTIVLIKEELDIRSKLMKKGLTSRITVLQLEKEYNDALYNLNQTPGTIEKLIGRQNELRNTLANISVESIESYSRELTEVNSEIMINATKINIFDSNIKELDIKAPVDGRVHDIRLKSPGEVAQPGEILLSLISTDKPLIAKVKISSRDIGHIEIGQRAILRITTYDSRRYGVVKGVVMKLSPSAYIPDDRTEPYYEGLIKLNKDYIDSSSGKMELFSGMTLTADIKTGSKTLFEYLLKPIYLAKKSSFNER